MDKKELISSFKNLELDEIRTLMRELREAEEAHLSKDKTNDNDTDPTRDEVRDFNNEVKVSASNGQSLPSIFDDVPLLDYEHLRYEPSDSWLMPAPLKQGERNVTLDESDESFMDTRLMGVRYRLLNYVIAAINEERSAAARAPPSAVPVKLKRNASYIIRRDSACSSPESEFPAPPVFPRTPPYKVPPPSPASHRTKTHLRGPTIYTPQGKPITLPVITDHNTIYTTSPPSVGANNTVIYSPESNSHWNRPNEHNLPTYVAKDWANSNGSISHYDYSPVGLNTTFTTTPNSNIMSTTMTRSTRIHVTPPRTLNSTFVQSPEDDFGGSNGGSHNTSMDEIHSLARMQEQSLHVNTTPRRLERRGTHTIGRGSSTEEESYSVPRRKLSNDTYSLEENSPSEMSSPISSPRDGQSYENVQMASEAFRRSMPNLAFVGNKKFSSIPAPPSQLRREPHYVSDPKIRSRTRTLRKPTPGLGLPNIDLMDIPPVDDTFVEARNANENKPYVRSNTFQKPTQVFMMKKSEEDLYRRTNQHQTAGGEGTARNNYYVPPQNRPTQIKPTSRPSALPAPRYSSQYRDRDVPQQYPGIPRPRMDNGRGSMMYSFPGGGTRPADSGRY